MPMAKMMLYAEILRQLRDIPNDYEEPKGGELEMEYEEEGEEEGEEEYAEQESRPGQADGRGRARS